MTERKTLTVSGVSCPSCAGRLKEELLRLRGVESVTVEELSGRIRVCLDGSAGPEAAGRVRETVAVLESGAHIGEEGRDEGAPSLFFPKREVLRLGAAAVLLGAGLAVSSPAESMALLVAAYLTAGVQVLRTVGRNVAGGRIFDEFFLMTIATLGAFAVGEYAEAVAVMLFYEAGELVQDLAVNRSRRAILSLSDIRPDVATVFEGGAEVLRRAEEVSVGSRILVKPGERVPLDGVVVEGSSSLDTSALTGESVPRDIGAGDEALAGAVNLSGTFVAEVRSPFGESTLSKALRLMEEARERKSPTERFITSFARWYTPAVVAGAALLAVAPPLAGFGSLRQWGYRALVFLVVSCPCALVISVPLAVFGGIGAASRRGVLLKGGNVLESLTKAKGVLFDKTGTLTAGVFSVSKVVPSEGLSREELLRMAAAAESGSNHPVARAVAGAWDEGFSLPVEEFPGMGVRAVVDGSEVLAGNDRLLREAGVESEEVRGGGAVLHVARDGRYAGYIVVTDRARPEAPGAVRCLRELGMDLVGILSGDRRENVESVASELGLDVWEGGLLPDGKLEAFERIRKAVDGTMVFVGDGLNDAPLLAAADVGLAMGGLGADAAMEASDGVLLRDHIGGVADALEIARRTKRTVWQNIVLALGVKGAVLLLGAWGMATMWEAVFADVGVALLATLNSSRVLMGE